MDNFCLSDKVPLTTMIFLPICKGTFFPMTTNLRNIFTNDRHAYVLIAVDIVFPETQKVFSMFPQGFKGLERLP